MIIRKGTFTCYFTDEGNRHETFQSLEQALGCAARYVGNSRYSKPFATEHTYLFGPGDGTTCVMVREDVEFAKKAPGETA